MPATAACLQKVGVPAANEALLRVKILSKAGQLPIRGSNKAAGYDLFSAEHKVVLKCGGREVVSTDISIEIPDGTYARIAPRSGLALKYGIDTAAGVVDGDYTGVIKVILFNHGDKDFTISPGDRIAQLILERIETPDVICVETIQATERGSGGFGSTGGFQEQ